MEKSNIEIRLEKKEEHQKVENLVRESFWNVYCPGCLEHYEGKNSKGKSNIYCDI